jgi:hypothetical protein
VRSAREDNKDEIDALMLTIIVEVIIKHNYTHPPNESTAFSMEESATAGKME